MRPLTQGRPDREHPGTVQIRYRLMTSLLFVLGAALALATGCARPTQLPQLPQSNTGVTDGGNWFGDNVNTIRNNVESLYVTTGITATVIGTYTGGTDPCGFAWATAQSWDRETPNAVAIVLAHDPPTKAVCLSTGARTYATQLGQNPAHAVDSFNSLADRGQWASAVTAVLGELQPPSSRRLQLPDKSIETAQIAAHKSTVNDQRTALVVTIIIPSLVLCAGVAMLAWRKRQRQSSARHHHRLAARDEKELAVSTEDVVRNSAHPSS